MKKCKEGHYYCFQDSKCKPIPKGYRRGVGGYLRKEREDEKEDSKKNGNGNGNGNNGSNGSNGNGSGNGNGVSGGNGGGNGSGGVGESFETIQNSDGETAAVIVDIIGPAHMRPRLNGNGVWKGTNITEVSLNPSQFLGALDKAKKMNRMSRMAQAQVDADKKSDNPNLTKSDTQVTQVGDQAPVDPLTVMAPRKINKKIKKLNQKDVGDYIPNLKIPPTPDEYPTNKSGVQNAHYEPDDPLVERKMTEKEKRKDNRLKKKYDKSDMKKSMQKQYGKEEGKKVYFATIRKQAMEEELDKKDKPYIKKLIKNLRKGSKTHAKQADKLEKAVNEESNPRIPRKKGQPANSKKHSDLYTDENPKGTIHGLGFKDVATAKASVSKIRNSSRSVSYTHLTLPTILRV